MEKPVFNPMLPAKQLLDIEEEIADIRSTDRESAQKKLADRMIEKQRKVDAKARDNFIIPSGRYVGLFAMLMNEKLTSEEYFDFFATALGAIANKPYASKFAMFQDGDNVFPQIQILAESDTFPSDVLESVPDLNEMDQVFQYEAGFIFNRKP